MITTRSLLTAFLLAPLCALTAMAQARPNFTGTWKLNQQKSKDSDVVTLTIEFNQKDNNLTEAFNTGQGGEFEAKYTIDGKESEVSTGDATIKATAKWDGDALVIDWRGPEEGRYFVRKLTLSADGKTMTINLKHSLPNGKMGEKIWVLEKQ
jgi:hypothetical protein